MTRFASATVTALNPPRIVMDGGYTPVPAQTSGIAISVGQHVRVEDRRPLRPLILGPIS